MNTTANPTIAQPATSAVPGSVRILTPPASLAGMRLQQGDGTGRWIDYASHPAYRDFVAASGFRDRLEALRVFARHFLLILCKRLISYELIPAHLRNPRSAGGLLRLLQRLVQKHGGGILHV